MAATPVVAMAESSVPPLAFYLLQPLDLHLLEEHLYSLTIKITIAVLLLELGICMNLASAWTWHALLSESAGLLEYFTCRKREKHRSKQLGQ